MKRLLLYLAFCLACLVPLKAQTPGTVTTINSLVANAIDVGQLQTIVAQVAPSLVNPQFSQSGGVITITADRVMTSAEISALKSACVAALFKVTTN